MKNNTPTAMEFLEEIDKFETLETKGQEDVCIKAMIEFTNYPTTVLSVASEGKIMHPTQKPVELMEYLIKTYTNEGELVLDNTAGSCTTAIAALNTNRDYICMEKDENYYNIGLKRVKEWYENKNSKLF